MSSRASGSPRAWTSRAIFASGSTYLRVGDEGLEVAPLPQRSHRANKKPEASYFLRFLCLDWVFLGRFSGDA